MTLAPSVLSAKSAVLPFRGGESTDNKDGKKIDVSYLPPRGGA